MLIPGFRSNNVIKKILAIIYYSISVLMVTQGIGYALFMLSLPFIVFSAIDLIKKRSNKAKVVLLVSSLICILSIALVPQKNNQNALINTPTPSQTSQAETSPVTPPPTPDVTPSHVTGRLELHFIDVGQADAILIIQNSEAMLIDGGNNADSDLVKTYAEDRGINMLKFVIGTHPDEDHIGGLDEVIKTFDIGTIIMPRVQATTKTFEDLISAIQSQNLKITAPIPGNEYNLGEARFIVLAPNSEGYEEKNNHSVVIRLTFGKNSILFTGDAEEISENEMLAKGYNLKSDILKVGHHGSDSSTTEQFLNAVSPKYAVISVGENNKYGHPAPEIMNRLQAADVTTYRTDEKGTIIAESDGETITFNFQKTAVTPAPEPTTKPSKTPMPSNTGNVIIDDVDLAGELVTIRNTSSANVNLTGWKLVSVTGNQTYNFPQGCVIKAGSTLTIASGNASGDLKWTNKNIWNNSGDSAELYDNGTLVSKK